MLFSGSQRTLGSILFPEKPYINESQILWSYLFRHRVLKLNMILAYVNKMISKSILRNIKA